MGRYLGKIQLTNKNIIVTGSCGLLGKEICRAIADFGGNIVLTDINGELVEKFAKDIMNEYTVSCYPYILDICSEESINSVLEALNDQNIAIDGLVNNAYPRNKQFGAIFENISPDSWKENVDMHLNGYFKVTQKVSKVMQTQREGNIVNLGSIYGILGPDFRIYDGTSMTVAAEYSAIKGGIINFTRYLSTYLAQYQIRVNSISPGGIFDSQAKSFVSKYCDRIPMNRMANADEIASTVVFFLSELSSYITGQNLIVDGGLSAW